MLFTFETGFGPRLTSAAGGKNKEKIVDVQ
jgi:hypothetical protein